MALSPWDPFREIDRMERFFRRTFEPRREEAFVSVGIEVSDENDHYLVRAEIPGVNEEQVDITLTGNVLSIRGEKSFERREGQKSYQSAKAQPSPAASESSASESHASKEGKEAKKAAKKEEPPLGHEDTALATSESSPAEFSRPLYSEVYYGSFERSLTLPDDIDAEKVDASYRNGVFFIEIGKKEQHRAKKISVTRH